MGVRRWVPSPFLGGTSSIVIPIMLPLVALPGKSRCFPLAGYQVTLHSFDLGAWPNTDRDSQVTLYDSTYNSLLGQYKNNVLQPIGD